MAIVSENMEKDDAVKSNARLVVSMLLTGKPFKSRDMAEAISGSEKRDIKTGSVSSILSRISDENKCSLGCFIHKSKQGNALVYSLVSEALALSEQQAYGLTLKKGKECYPLDQAVGDFPELQKYLPPPPSESVEYVRKPLFQRVKNETGTLAPGSFIRFKPSSRQPSNENRNIDFSIRYSTRYALSFSTTLTTFILACCTVVLSIAACCLVAYMFFYPLLVMIIVILIISGIGFLFWKNRQT